MNENVVKIIDAYLDAEQLPVPHAILLEGPWGSGKTYFLKNVYERDRTNRRSSDWLLFEPFIYVSLFGARSAADIEARIFKAAHPVQALVGGFVGPAVESAGEFFRLKKLAETATKKASDLFTRRLRDGVLVFDDVERIESAAFGEAMGLINSLIADYDRRVILVSDEEQLLKLHDGSVWADQNEKLIGRRARIQPDFESVALASVANFHNAAVAEFIKGSLSEAVSVAAVSGVSNLRSLSWAFVNAAAFAECLLEDGNIPADHILRTLLLVIATTLWFRSTKIKVDDLVLLPTLSMRMAVNRVNRREEQEPSPAEMRSKAFADTFTMLEVEAPPVDYSFIIGFERSGVLDAGRLTSWIKTQFGFGLNFTEPAWRKLWYSSERSFEETNAALQQLADQLSTRQLEVRGEILHAAGQAIRFGAAGSTLLTGGQDIVPFFLEYINALVSEKRLKSERTDYLPFEYDAYQSLGYNSQETAEFQQIYGHMQFSLNLR